MGSDVTGTIVPVYPQSGKAEVHTWQLRRAVASCLERTKARGLRRSARRRPPRRARPRRPDAARTAASTAPRRSPNASAAAQRLKFDEFLRMQLALVARKRALAAEATGIVHAVDGPLVPAFHAALPVPAHRRPDGAPSREITADMAGARADAPAAAGRGRVGQDRRRAHRAAHRGAGRLPGRVHGADRGARRAARAHDARAARAG